ncbi:leucine-rich repeat-containing protein 43 [Pseudonaja textilis]|uniref:leucine-rich repeat-containing protein 43 n=1 Tax=Pseudonaja textilis TaxID=8673 RepID=UPI000EAAAE7C|nr:leucine-rich repeat-containing protein 43 [Pseudonaja textilis]
MEGLSASAAFWDHLRTLCLDQFPCGVGSWNKSRFPPRLPPRLHGLPAPRPVTLLRRNGLLSPNEETVEALTEFLRCPDSPWALPPDCNPPEQQLRELAVQHPQIVRTGFVCCYFRSLRIVNKGLELESWSKGLLVGIWVIRIDLWVSRGTFCQLPFQVTEIDVGLLKFPNLEELILTANHISTIPAANLPPGLKVLELCGNEVQSLKDLCTSPPAGLQHLGLGHNCQIGSSEEQFLAAAFWPNLVSLDLCYNNFTNLLSLLSTLSTLKKLRVLVLQGNPFALLPGYRGFTIDSLPHLSVFDDVIITPEERHNFLNLATFPEILLLDVQLIVTLGKMRGVPNPFNPEDLESSSGSPIVNYSYYVTYEFAKGERKEKAAGKHRGTLSGKDAATSPGVMVAGETVEPVSSKTSPKSDLQPEPEVRNLENEEEGESLVGGFSSPLTKMRLQPNGGRNGKLVTVAGWTAGFFLLAHLANTHSTAKKGWTETAVDWDYRKEHLTEDLVSLKAYLLAGTTVSVVQEKVVSWPVIPTLEEKPGKKGKGAKEKADSGKKEKGKGKDSGKAGNKKKKKSLSPELRSDPPIVKILGSFHINLEKLLAGDSVVETVCNFGVQIIERNVTPPSPKDKEGKKGAKKDLKAKPGTDSVNSKKTPPPPTPSPVKGKGRKKDSSEGPDQQLGQPLTVEFQMQHIKWDSASSALKMLEALE